MSEVHSSTNEPSVFSRRFPDRTQRLIMVAIFVAGAITGCGNFDAATGPSRSVAADARSIAPAAAGIIAPTEPVAVSGTGAGFAGPGPSAVGYSAPTAYTCNASYYVSTLGNDANAGTGANTAWLTLAHAASQSLGAGSCVIVEPGVYPQASSLKVAHGGTDASPSGYVAWRCAVMPFRFLDGALQGEGQGCVIRATAPMFALVSVTTSFLAFDGFEIDGNDFAAQRGFQVSGPNVHHVSLYDSDVHHIGQNGISMVYADWFSAAHNVWHDNSACSVNFLAPCTQTIGSYGSGLSIWEPMAAKSYAATSADDLNCSTVPVQACFHVIVAYNVAYHDYNGQSGNTNTDGEGIILDTWNAANYTAPALVMGNVVYDNGGSGIEVTNSSAGGVIVIANNTVFGDHWDTHSPYTWSGEIVQDNGYGETSINNIAYAVGGPGILAGNPPFVGQEGGGASSSWNGNLSFPSNRNRLASGFAYPTTGLYPNSDGVDPTFVAAAANSTTANFALRPGSPAIGFGVPFTLWPQRGRVDVGACPSSLATCP